MRIHILDERSDVIFSNLEKQCVSCFEKCENEGSVVFCEKENMPFRLGLKATSKGSYFLCTKKEFSKTTGVFKEKLNLLINTVPDIIRIREKAKVDTIKYEQDKYQRIVHNLRTLNGQAIQEQYSFISQDVLSETEGDVKNKIKEMLSTDLDKATDVFFNLFNYNTNIKNEFITHEKLSFENPVLSFNRHDLRRVIYNAFHSFAHDFSKKNINVSIFPERRKVDIDYETVRAAFYHFFHNCVKYTRQNSKLTLKCEEKSGVLEIHFLMNSLHIKPSEVDKIFIDGFSGEKASSLGSAGAGLGMGWIKKALELNNGYVKVIPGVKIERLDKREFSINEFIFVFQVK